MKTCKNNGAFISKNWKRFHNSQRPLSLSPLYLPIHPSLPSQRTIQHNPHVHLERTIQHNQHVQLERPIQHNCTSQHNCPAQRNTTQRSAAQLNQLNISAAQHQHSSAVLSSLHLQRLSSHLHLSQKELRRTLARERCRAGAVRMRLQHRSRQPDQPLHLYPRPPPLSTNPLPFSCPPPPLVPPARAVAASIVATATPVAIARATTGRRPVQR